MTATHSPEAPDTGARLRTFVLIVFVVGVLGTAGELVLLGHFEDAWQWAPLALLPLGLLAAAWHRITRRRLGTRVFQGVMAAFVVSGLAGLWLHYNGNAEFEIEMYPAIGGWELVREALSGATPALAPAAMIQLGLLGLASTYRSLALARAARDAADRPRTHEDT